MVLILIVSPIYLYLDYCILDIWVYLLELIVDVFEMGMYGR